MNRLSMVRWAFAIALLALLSSCGGGSGNGPDAPSTGTPDALIAQPEEALQASVERMLDASAARAEFRWKVAHESFDIHGDGTLTVAGPDGLDITATYRGKGERIDERSSSELLVLGQMAYLKANAYGDRWIVFTQEELAPEWPYIQNLIAARSPLAYDQTIEGLAGDVSDVGMEDGFAHFQSTIDAGTLLNALADAYESRGQQILANRFSGGPLQIDIWLDPVTLLPHAIEAAGTIQFDDQPTEVSVRVDYSDLNGPELTLPAAPSEVVPAATVIPQ